MRFSIFLAAGLLLLTTAPSIAAMPVEAEPGSEATARWLPEICLLSLGAERAPLPGARGRAKSDEARWNHFYRLGIEAIGTESYDRAELHFCHALEAAGSFGPRDIRFAETLDELGLVSYMLGDDELAEAMQGAAAAEMLLALGPPAKDLAAEAEESCLSSVANYMVRLGWIFERQGRKGDIEPLMKAPYRILGRGYLPAGAVLDRLDWLITQYLLVEDFAAADWLTSLRDDEP